MDRNKKKKELKNKESAPKIESSAESKGDSPGRSNDTKPRAENSSSSRFYIFGEPMKLPTTGLPTLESVMRHYGYIAQKLRTDANNKNPTSKLVAKTVATEVQALWHKMGRPTILLTSIASRILRIHIKCKILKKSLHTGLTKVKIEELRTKGKALFDISGTHISNNNPQDNEALEDQQES
ncbi:uncharacterized protein LOC129797351 [Lutzomyia longipalpis]|uniref:uncharacterized protein LOC129797351 n=1 Tax=Lutzomyia longipalpis TaxID=7200 RepID=UPI0024843E0A|nr:uncharacterized protein LOC129797351 [Lutzomyia longipalpis]